MRKIPTIFERDKATNRRYVTRTPPPDCGWVFAGEGRPTYKWDGTAVLVDDAGDVWKRREVKAGKPPPVGFRHIETDLTTGKSVGWMPARHDDPDDRWLNEAVDRWHAATASVVPAGTYELVGPKVQGNPHRFDHHLLVRHGTAPGVTWLPNLVDTARTYDALVEAFRTLALIGEAEEVPGFEGVVWPHPDGRMAKLKAKDLRELAS